MKVVTSKKHADQGERIRAAREARGRTLSRVAVLVDVSFGLVAAWERGSASPPRAKLVLLAEALGVPPEYITSGETNLLAEFREAKERAEAARIEQKSREREAKAQLEAQRAAKRLADRSRLRELRNESKARYAQVRAIQDARRCRFCGDRDVLPVGNLCWRCWT